MAADEEKSKNFRKNFNSAFAGTKDPDGDVRRKKASDELVEKAGPKASEKLDAAKEETPEEKFKRKEAEWEKENEERMSR